MEATKNASSKTDFQKEFFGTILMDIINISNSDIKITREELETRNTILVSEGEIHIGKMNALEIKIISFVYKTKRELIKKIAEYDDIQNKQKIESLKSSHVLSRNIKFAKLFLDYLVKNRFSLPDSMSFDFKKDFQITGKHTDFENFEEE